MSNEYSTPPEVPAWSDAPVIPPAPQPQRTNTLAILSLVFAFVFAPVGLILGIVSLSQIKKTHEEGHGLAIAGVAVAAAQIVIAVFAFLFMILMMGVMAVSVATVGPHMLPDAGVQSDVRSLAFDLEEYATVNGRLPSSESDVPNPLGYSSDNNEMIVVCYSRTNDTAFEIWGFSGKGNTLYGYSSIDGDVTKYPGREYNGCGSSPSAEGMIPGLVWAGEFAPSV